MQNELYSQYQVQPFVPFTSCFGFNNQMSKEKFIEAFVEGVLGYPVSAWPDIVTSGNMSIVKLDGRPYTSPYFRFDNFELDEICVIYGFSNSSSFSPYIEQIWEKINSNYLIDETNNIVSDTTENFKPVIALVRRSGESEIGYVIMDGELELKFGENEEEAKMRLSVIKTGLEDVEPSKKEEDGE